MIWFETPSNPLLEVIDIRTVSAITKGFNHDIIVVVVGLAMTGRISQTHRLDSKFFAYTFLPNKIWCGGNLVVKILSVLRGPSRLP